MFTYISVLLLHKQFVFSLSPPPLCISLSLAHSLAHSLCVSLSLSICAFLFLCLSLFVSVCDSSPSLYLSLSFIPSRECLVSWHWQQRRGRGCG